MSYRDPVEAARARRDALDATLSRLDENDPRRTALESELEAVHETIEASRKLALSVLSNVRIATPCPASWEAMTGDDRVRHCALCEKNVYDLAGLTAWETVQLLAEQGEQLCVQLHRRRDGSIITADCEVGRRRRRKRGAAIAAGALAVAVGGAVVASAPAPAPAAAMFEVPAVTRGAPSFEPQARFQFDEDAFLYGPPPEAYPEEEVCDSCVLVEADQTEAPGSMHDRSDRIARPRAADGEAP